MSTASLSSLRRPEPGKLAFLDGLRGWASLWVVFNHLQEHLRISLSSIPPFIREPLIMWGGNGVFVFFGISGYVIARSLQSVHMNGRAVANFGARRVVRLTPPYYCAIVVTLLVNYTSTVFKKEHFEMPSLGAWVANLLYLPELLRVRVINGTHWTLYIEMQFYLLLALLAWFLASRQNTKAIRVRDVSLTVVAVLAMIYPVLGLFDGRSSVFLPYLSSFVSGCFIYWFGQGSLKTWLFWSFSALLVGSAVVHRQEVYVATAASHCLIYAVSIIPNGFSRLLTDRVSQLLGHISYSLYLIHAPLLGGIGYFGVKIFGSGMAAELLLVIPMVVICVVCGYVFYRLIEKPAIRWSRSLKPSPVPTPS